MQDSYSDYGFNIITEKISPSELNEKSYEGGDQTRLDSIPYNKDAQILQCILEYGVKINSEYYFDNATICKDHLLKKCGYYVNLYKSDKTNDPSRFKDIKEDVSRLLEKLIYLGALNSESENINNSASTKKYRFTKIGRLLGFLLSFKNNNGVTSEQLYKHLVDFFESKTHAYAKLCFVFLKKCSNTSPLFTDLVDSLFDLLKYAPSNKYQFINQIKRFTPTLDKSSWDLIYDSLCDIDEGNSKLYNILLYNLKLDLEEFHESKSHDVRKFERIRFKLKNELFFVTLEGRCNECRLYTATSLGLIDYLRTFANKDEEDLIHKIATSKCPNPRCQNGFINFEYIMDTKYVVEQEGTKKSIDNGKPKRKIKPDLRLRFIGEQVDIVGIVFEKKADNTFTKRSQRIQATLEFLLDNPDKPYKTRVIVENLLKNRKEIFPSIKKVSEINSDIIDDFHDPFASDMKHLKLFDLVEHEKVPSEKDPNVMVDEFWLTKFGKAIALLAKIERCDYSTEVIDTTYKTWKDFFNDQPFSLDLFCKLYFRFCKDVNLFEDFIKIFNNYLHSKTNLFYSLTDLFTQIILFRFDNDKSKNKKLYQLWKKAWFKLEGDDYPLFTNHVNIHVHRLLEKKVHNLDKFEAARYEYGYDYNIVVVEIHCKNCPDEYFYLPILLYSYLSYIFYDEMAEEISEYINKNKIRCQHCYKRNFSFISI